MDDTECSAHTVSHVRCAASVSAKGRLLAVVPKLFAAKPVLAADEFDELHPTVCGSSMCVRSVSTDTHASASTMRCRSMCSSAVRHAASQVVDTSSYTPHLSQHLVC
jgi:type II secretory pathway predicted ATPase ExeA